MKQRREERRGKRKKRRHGEWKTDLIITQQGVEWLQQTNIRCFTARLWIYQSKVRYFLPHCPQIKYLFISSVICVNLFSVGK